MDCSEAEDFYNINEKIGSEDPIATDDSLASASPNRQQASQTNQRRQRPQNQPQQPQSRPQQGQGRRQQRPQDSKPNRGNYVPIFLFILKMLVESVSGQKPVRNGRRGSASVKPSFLA